MLLEDADYQQLVGYLTSVFGKLYGRLDERVGRWALKVEPLDPQTYPKGNTRQYFRWELPEHPPAKHSYLAGLYASEKDCYSAKHRLLARIVFMEDAPAGQGLFDDVTSLRERLLAYDRTLADAVCCPITGEAVTIHDIQMALMQNSRIGSSELNIDFVNISGNGNRLDPLKLHWIKPPYYLYSLRQAVLDTTKLKLLLDKVQTKAYLTDRRLTGQVASNRDRRWELSLNDPQFGCHPESCVTGGRKQAGRNGRQRQLAHIIRQSRAMSSGLQKASVEGCALQKRGPLPGGCGPGKGTKTTPSSPTLSGWLLVHTWL